MLRLFHRDVDVGGCGLALHRLLTAVAQFQVVLSEVENTVQGRRMELFHQDVGWRDLHLR